MSKISIVKNHWGWTPRGIRTWMKWWAWPIEVWGIQERGHFRDGVCHRDKIFRRRVKIGPICFPWGRYRA